MRKRNTIVVTIILIMVQLCALAQIRNEYGPFRFVYEGMMNTNNMAEIEFIDTTTKEVISTFNLIDKNPFNHLDYPIINTSNHGNIFNLYDLSNIELKNVGIPGQTFYYLKPYSSSSVIKSATLTTYHTWGIFEDTTLVVKLTAEIREYDSFIALADMFYFLDQKGNVITTLNDFDYNIGEFAVTGQRYFLCAYGGPGPSQLGEFENFGYLAYDMISKELIVQQEFEKKYQAIGVRGYKGLLRVGLIDDEHTEDLIYFDFTKNRKYLRNLHDKVLFSIRETNKDGIIYLNDGGMDTLYFERDFKVEDIR